MDEKIYRASLELLSMVMRPLTRGGSLIICLHSVSSASKPVGGSSMTIRAAFLGKLIHALRRDRVALVSLKEALVRLDKQDSRPFVALTFDDGYRDFYEEVFPLALKYDVPVTTFLATGIIDRTAPMWWNALEGALESADVFYWESTAHNLGARARRQHLGTLIDRRFRSLGLSGQRALLAELSREYASLDLSLAYDAALTWDMVAHMARSGLVEVGSHTIDHPVLSQLGSTATAYQLRGSRERIKEEIGINARFLAYPFGQAVEVGPTAESQAKMAGYEAAFSTSAALISPAHLQHRWFLPRLMLSSKAQSTRIVSAYRSGASFWLRNAQEKIFQ